VRIFLNLGGLKDELEVQQENFIGCFIKLWG
jgi:hypothetical protein